MSIELSEIRKKRIFRFLNSNKNNLPSSKMAEIRNLLSTTNEEQWINIESISFKEPMILLILSITIGNSGIDRFMTGHKITGTLKLLLSLFCGFSLIAWYFRSILRIWDFVGFVDLSDYMNTMTYELLFVIILFCIMELWWLIDIFRITSMTQNYNYKLLKEVCH